MGLRTAIQNSRVLTGAIAFAFVWILLTVLNVGTSFAWLTALSGDFIGRNSLAGVVGVVVMIVLLGALLTLYSELSEEDPVPESWPPSE